MKCKWAKELMGAYLYGDLSAEEMRELRLHANGCAECREDLKTRGAAVALIANAPPELSDIERQKIAWVVEGAVRRDTESARPGFRLAMAFGGVAVAAAAGIVVVGLLFSRPPDPRANGVRTVKKRSSATVTVKIAEEPAGSSANDSTVGAAKPDDKAADSDALRISDAVADAVARTVRHGTGVAVSRHAPKDERREEAARPETAEDVRPVEDDQDATNTSPTKLPEVSGPNDARTSPSYSDF